jgi:Fe-Mn family superoxide dismutase
MAFELPPLPYAEDALEPEYTARTISFHYGKHHKTYVDTLNKLVDGTDLADKSLEDVIMAVAGKPDKQPVFNNAAQVWNHTFFWNGMKPGGGGAPTGAIAEKIAAAFGGWDKEQADFSSHKFVEDFKAAAVGRFGSGWAWLVSDNGELKIVSTPNAEMPAAPGVTPLLVVDVWEHAYYLDYQNLRPVWVQTFFEKLVNWDFVNENLAKAK